jgi:hypothetical protein
LLFKEEDYPDAGSTTDFWASAIIIENGGELFAYGADIPWQPFGFNRGTLTIHLYGKNEALNNTGQFVGENQGALCKTVDLTGTSGPCGIPKDIWESKGAKSELLPGLDANGVQIRDYFYQYEPLHADGKCSDTSTGAPGSVWSAKNGCAKTGEQVGYFGNKVLAVSYGGTLVLQGKKGATYDSLDAKASGRSWTRLNGTITAGETSLNVDGPLDGEAGDAIVVTTTDYVPNHSEALAICGVSGNTITFTADLTYYSANGRCPNPNKGVQWTHNGQQYSLDRVPERLNIKDRLNNKKKAAETRAAVALLTRSIRIVSEGDNANVTFPPVCTKEPCANYYFGGHTIARQGFKRFQVQGVEFKQLGQGGNIGHYPIHFHMARKTPAGTFVRDSSINESMTRWITIHGTQGVEFARNVGYKSIGHGFYLEDATETDNKFYSNLGIFARAAVDNDDNPRKVPGILASPNATSGPPSVKYGSDKDMPSVFWITNGWNDFQGNVAAGAGFCGFCYWQVPASISGHSRHQKWQSYAAEQRCPEQRPSASNPDPSQLCPRTGTSPLMNFDGNYCTSAMTSFNTVGYLQNCPGVGTDVLPISNPYAPKLTDWENCGTGTGNRCADDYYPKLDGGGSLKQATLCPPGACDDPPPNAVFTGSISKTTMTVTPITSGTIYQGMTITGTGVSPGTIVTGIGNIGTNGAGEYTINISHDPAVTSTTLTGKATDAKALFTGIISDTTMTVTSVTSGTIYQGMTITGRGVRPGTSVKELGTGRGGNGTYIVNLSHDPSVTSTVLTGTATAIDGTLCQNANQTNCLPTVINDYTTSFNWTEYNFSAVWLRVRWHLVSNSFVSDVQNAGLTFVSGGDYTHASAIRGLWELALKTVFVGQTQKDSNAPFASSTLNWLKCDNQDHQSRYCISKNNSFTLGGFTGFAVSQHMFNIYDGPGDQDSNAYLDIKKYDLGKDSTASVYKHVGGIPKAVLADKTQDGKTIATGNCYIQNAAIGWKQPNGFYYPPTFHSRNLFFDNVDIRHYVIVPQFAGNTYKTDVGQVAKRYCAPLRPGLFNNYSANDRQTILTDDDGSLTGYANTISINTDDFFRAPVEGIECQSDGAVPEGGTARTSPYQMVTTVVYPDDAQHNAPGCGPNWDSECSNPGCFGVPLHRLYQTWSEKRQGKAPEFIRMAGFNICQRQTMTVNHGLYYVDLTASSKTQAAWPKKNIFVGGKKYHFFLIYANKDTEQTYKMYVGPGFNAATDLQLIRANIAGVPLKITSAMPYPDNQKAYDKASGILTVTLNLSAFAKDFTSAAKDLCVPRTFCDWFPDDKLPRGGTCVGRAGFGNLAADERNLTCSYAGKDIDCPSGGCVGFSVKLPDSFNASDQTKSLNTPSKLAQCFPKNDNWNVTPVQAPSPLAGACYQAPIKTDFCP